MAAKKEAGKRTRVRLSREIVLRAALELADEGGLASLSMRNLGQALGVEAMSLYKHVANKDDVLDGILDMVASEIEVPTVDGSWKDAMRRRARSAHEVLMRHPWAAALFVSHSNPGPAMLRYVDATLGCLLEAGFSFALADHAWNAIDSYVYGFTQQKLNFPFVPEEYAAVAAAYLPHLPAEQYPYLYGMTREVAERRHNGLHDLSFGLELLLDGLERLRAGESGR